MIMEQNKISDRLRDVIELLNHIIDFESHNVFLSDNESTPTRVWHYLYGFQNLTTRQKRFFVKRDNPFAEVINTLNPLLNETPFFMANKTSKNKKAKHGHELWLPLIVDGKAIGALCIGASYQRLFSNYLIWLCQCVVQTGMLALLDSKISKLWERLRFGILHRNTYFSGIPNLVKVFSEQLARCQKILPRKRFWSTVWLAEFENLPQNFPSNNQRNYQNNPNVCSLTFQHAHNIKKSSWSFLRQITMRLDEKSLKAYYSNLDAVSMSGFQELDSFFKKYFSDYLIGTKVVLPAIYEGKLVGLFTFISPYKDAINNYQINTLAVLIAHFASVIENTNNREKAEKQKKWLTTLYGTSVEISQSFGLDQVLHSTITAAVDSVSGAKSGAILTWRPHAKMIQCHKKTPAKNFHQEQIEKYSSLDEMLTGKWKDYVNEEIVSGLCVPLEAWGRRLGALCLYNDEIGTTFRSIDKILMCTFAANAALAIHNASINSELHNLGLRISHGQLTIKEIFNQTVTSITNICDARSANMLLYQDTNYPELCIKQKPIESDSFGLGVEFKIKIKARKKGITYQVLRSRKPKVFDQSSKKYGINGKLKKLDIKAYIGLPMMVQDELLGVLFVHYDKPHTFSKTEKEMLSPFANLAAASVKSRQYIEEIKNQTKKFRKLRQINKIVESKWKELSEPKKFLDWLSDKIADLFDSDRCMLLVFDTTKKSIIARGSCYYKERFMNGLKYKEINQGISGKVLHGDYIERGAAKSDNAGHDKRNTGIAGVNARKHKTGPLIVSPIWDNNKIFATLTIGRPVGELYYTEFDRDLAVSAAGDIKNTLRKVFLNACET